MTAWLLRWLRSLFPQPDLVSREWLRQQKQGEREEYEGVSFKGKFVHTASAAGMVTRTRNE